jgi:autotransporter-associated beta strand protein
VLTYTNSLTISGNITGTGGLTKQGSGTLYLRGANTFLGRTFIDTGTLSLLGSSSLAASTNLTLSGGTLEVTARSDGLLTVNSGQALTGNGTVSGNVLVAPGASVSPGNAIGTITIANGSVTLAGTAFMQVSKTTGTSDLINGATTITYGGTLSLTNFSGALSGGESFKLFDAAAYTGAFTNISPATPGPNLVWDTSSLLTNGTIRVLYVAPPQFTGFSRTAGSQFNLAFTGAPGQSYRVWASTNVAATPIGSTWDVLTTGVFSAGGTGTFTDTATTNYPARFYLISFP